MGVLDNLGLGGHGKHKVLSYVVVITPNGTAKLDKPGVPEYQWRILNHLAENGPCPVRDLARELHMDENRLKPICRRMEEDSYITRRSGNG